MPTLRTGAKAPVCQAAAPREEECADQGPNEIDFILHKEIDCSNFIPSVLIFDNCLCTLVL